MADWRTNLTAARERLARLEAAELDLMDGKAVSKVSAGGESAEFVRSANPMADIQRSIRECRMTIARLSGMRTGGAFIPVLR